MALKTAAASPAFREKVGQGWVAAAFILRNIEA